MSGLQCAAAQGQKIYQIDRNNRAQLANIQMSGEDMANEINQAINSGGYVIVPEKAVDGTGRNAVYVYYVNNPATGSVSWKISGGLNGGTMSNENSGNGQSFLELLVLTMLGVSAAHANSNEDIANETAKALIPWYGHILNLLGLYDLWSDMTDAGCSPGATGTALGRQAILMFAPLLVLLTATGPISLILWTVFLVFFYMLFINWLLEVNHTWSVNNCRKD